MAYKDLREFIQLLEEKGQLLRISAEVDPELEITEITDRISKAAGPALLFENVKGSEMPVLINAYGSSQRMAWSLGVEDLDDIGNEITELLQLADMFPTHCLTKSRCCPYWHSFLLIFPRRSRTVVVRKWLT